MSQVEQELACTEDHSSAVPQVESLMGNPQVSAENKLRVVLLYALRYEKEATNRIRRFTEQLPEQMQRLVSEVLRLAPVVSRMALRIAAEDRLSGAESGDQSGRRRWPPVCASFCGQRR